MTPFEKLDPLVQYHIVNTLGWRNLRPLQEQSIEPIQRGEHCLLLAPTAGGKTEAAIFPVLSKMCAENWTGLSVLYICPIRALLNNLHTRLEHYSGMVGRRCGIWHGDVTESQKNKIRTDSPDILLTTPESLEVMLISTKPEGRENLKGVRLVIIDEIHAFAGDDRGWHLLALLERIGRLAGREIQRIGLSATVGNPEELLQWLAGHCDGKRQVINPTAPAIATQADVQLDFVGSLANAAIVISRLHRGEKRLVFCDSRSGVEELGNELRQLGVSTFLSHSSLSVEERRAAEEAFAQASDCVIVATSTLELGIDVGDLDRVIQIDAPYSVASFLQRLGRTGRRLGTTRNCLFLATDDDSLLRAAALLHLWQSGFVENIVPPPRPLHLIAQQLMALCLQEKGVGVRDWKIWLKRLVFFREASERTIDEIVDHLLEESILFWDGIKLSFGSKGENQFGRRHFLELISVFTSPPLFTVLQGRKDLGTVHQLAFLKHRPENPAILSLGGRSWEVESVDWIKKVAQVVPSAERGKSRWVNLSTGLKFGLCRAIHKILCGDSVSERWSSRTRERMAIIRNDYSFLADANELSLLGQPLGQSFRWFTFAGDVVNLAICNALSVRGYPDTSARSFFIQINHVTNSHDLKLQFEWLGADNVIEAFDVPIDYLEQLKFSTCLPRQLASETIAKRLLNRNDLKELSGLKTRLVLP